VRSCGISGSVPPSSTSTNAIRGRGESRQREAAEREAREIAETDRLWDEVGFRYLAER
jgi:hypothetical protein